jgi:hypothetical protein
MGAHRSWRLTIVRAIFAGRLNRAPLSPIVRRGAQCDGNGDGNLSLRGDSNSRAQSAQDADSMQLLDLPEVWGVVGLLRPKFRAG